nr:immunoglobulin heavy chain junction region [Homo sapiens]MBB1843106.1 immunoglobulin heavy chain junction region [Homo sapiens]MBB1843340.1 immunoglobulin heavy chain junction region [Homo sapiens]MBB1857227.1 immunoglobulin heavy chain junction region [Homo sapiens]MBB1859575.1 immunoglobulin heavy chain junction region [Homo sapiens]
CLTGAFDYW